MKKSLFGYHEPPPSLAWSFDECQSVWNGIERIINAAEAGGLEVRYTCDNQHLMDALKRSESYGIFFFRDGQFLGPMIVQRNPMDYDATFNISFTYLGFNPEASLGADWYYGDLAKYNKAVDAIVQKIRVQYPSKQEPKPLPFIANDHMDKLVNRLEAAGFPRVSVQVISGPWNSQTLIADYNNLGLAVRIFEAVDPHNRAFNVNLRRNGNTDFNCYFSSILEDRLPEAMDAMFNAIVEKAGVLKVRRNAARMERIHAIHNEIRELSEEANKLVSQMENQS